MAELQKQRNYSKIKSKPPFLPTDSLFSFLLCIYICLNETQLSVPDCNMSTTMSSWKSVTVH